MFELLHALGGVALILFGVRFLRKGLDKLVGPRLPLWVARLTGGPVRTAATGLGVGLLAPSSSSQGILAVSLVRDGVIDLKRAIVLLAGAYLGATLLLHLVAVDVAHHAPLGLLLGVVLFQGFAVPPARGLGQLILAVSFILMGVELVGAIAAPLSQSSDLRALVDIAVNYPWLAAAIAGVLAAFVQSSTATLAVFIGFALHDGEIVNHRLIVEVIVGANVGVSALAIASSWNDLAARRFMLATLVGRLAVAVAAIGWLVHAADALAATPGSLAQQAALAHTAFNAAALVLALALAPALAVVVPRFVRPHADPHTIAPSPIDRRWADDPGIAFSQTKGEISLAVRVTASMLRDSWTALESRDELLLADIRDRDDTVDLVEKHVKSFLTRQLTNELEHRDVRRRLLQLRFVGDLENIADAVDRRICTTASKISKRGLWFNAEEWAELKTAFDLVAETVELAGATCAEERREHAKRLLQHKDAVRDLELDLRERHFDRLQRGDQHSVETTDLYVELLAELKHIAHLAAGVGHSVLDLTHEKH